MQTKLKKRFFDRPATIVAHELLGKFLVYTMSGEKCALMITEVEAYGGPEDMASHARFGKTLRTAAMFGPPGTIYVYFTYGMHFMLNIACLGQEIPSAVLLRAAGVYKGPARLTKALGIDKKLNGLPLGIKSGLWIEDRGVIIKPRDIKKTPRVGIAYAGEKWAHKPWRFVLIHGFDGMYSKPPPGRR